MEMMGFGRKSRERSALSITSERGYILSRCFITGNGEGTVIPWQAASVRRLPSRTVLFGRKSQSPFLRPERLHKLFRILLVGDLSLFLPVFIYLIIYISMDPVI